MALAVVHRLPAVVGNALASHLAMFDQPGATSDWAIQNFIEIWKAG